MIKIINNKRYISLACAFYLMLIIVLFPRHSFAQSLQTNKTVADSQAENTATQKNSGRQIFISHCVLCHGLEGKGDGRMARLINNPPPFNLTQSTRPANYLKSIISLGGESLSRSPQMPAWREELNEAEIEALVSYLLKLRENK